MDEQRAEFEAWAKSKGAPKDGWWIRQIDDGGYSCHAVDMAWDAWQAATQRQQERIAELEAQVQALTTRLAAAKETAMTACYVVGYEIAAMGNVHEPSGQVVNRCAAAIDAAIARATHKESQSV